LKLQSLLLGLARTKAWDAVLLLARSSLGAARRALYFSYRGPSRAGGRFREAPLQPPTRMEVPSPCASCKIGCQGQITQRRMPDLWQKDPNAIRLRGWGVIYTRITSGLVQRGKSSRAELLGISSAVILKACAFRERTQFLALEKGRCPSSEFLEHFHSLFFLRSKRGDADALGLPSGISPRPRCGSDPQKKNLLLISRILCKFRRTSRNRRYAPAGHLLRGVWPSIMYNDHAL
jgi:hypothetical protein